MPTDQLVDQCAAGCAGLCAPAGLHAAYSAHAGAITGYGHRLLGDLGLAEEITQDVFVRAWRHCAGYDDTAGLMRTWLFAIARNAIIDAVRARDTRPRLATVDRPDPANPTDDYARLDTAWLLEEALHRIAPCHRATLTTVFMDGHNYPHTARILGIPVGTVKSRIHNGLRALRATLGRSPEPIRP